MMFAAFLSHKSIQRARLAVIGALLSPLCWGAYLHAAPTTAQWQQLNDAWITQQVRPNYQTFAQASQRFDHAIHQLCQTPSKALLSASQQEYRELMQAWQPLQPIQFGPITLFMRNYAIQYWPDKRNSIGKHLQEALNKMPSTVDVRFFNQVGVSVKGLPALERLLFGHNEDAVFSQQDRILTPNAPECRLASAIANYVALHAKATSEEWTAYAQDLLLQTAAPSYSSAVEVSALFVKILVETPEALRDNKVLTPLADSLDNSRWPRSEAWRSQLSLINLAINLDSLQALYQHTTPLSLKSLLIDMEQPELANTLSQTFDTIKATLAQIAPVEQAQLTAVQYQQLSLVAQQLTQLHGHLKQMAQLLEIPLGFNSRDGD